MTFISLITTAFSSVFYGVIVTAVIMAILYVLLKMLNDGIVQSIPFYVTGVVLAILLIIQCSLMIGAIQAKDTTEAVEIYLSQMVEGNYGTVSAQDSQKVMDAITENFPIIGSFIDIADFSGHDISNLPKVMRNSMEEFLSSYIWHRVWWILGIIATACLIAICFRKRPCDYSVDMNADLGLY